MNRNSNRLPIRQKPAPGSETACRFFARGACRNGTACQFSHAGETPQANWRTRANPAPQPAVIPPGSARNESDSRAKVPCHFYLSGSCRNGASCPYAHPETPESSEIPGTGAHGRVAGEGGSMEKDDAKPDDWIRNLLGAVVHFGEGAVIAKTALQSDFSAVRLDNIPPGSSPASISVLLGRLGFPTPTSCIRFRPGNLTVPAAADVRVEDPTFAKRLCTTLSADRTVAQVKATPINAPVPQGTNFHRVECKKVHCSWHLPSRTIWLNFASRGVAQRVSDKFSAGSYTILGQVVKSSKPDGKRDVLNPLPWTVILTDVPGEASRADAVASIPSSIRPGHTEMGTPSYDCDMATANALVKSLLEKTGRLEWWEDGGRAGGKRAKAKARFQDQGDAPKAAATLGGSTLPFNSKGKLTIQPVFSARFKVWDHLYKSVEAAVDAQKHAWLAKHVYFTAYEPAREHRVLRLEGEDSKAVAEGMKVLETILAGELAMVGERALWTPSFGVKGEMYLKLKALGKRLGILIVRNRRMSQLRLYGPPAKCKEAQGLLAELVAEDSSTATVIELDEEKFLWACRGGFRELAKLLGQKVIFDIISTPKRIFVTGSDKDTKTAIEMVKNRKEARDAEAALADGADCAICWTEAENAVQTRCGHTYCADCFETFCFSGANGKDSGIKCEGDSGNCQATMPLEELQEHLASNTFEDLLQASFASHVKRRPDAFRYCPTADCAQIYRTLSAGTPTTLFTCPKCLTSVCTSCHVPHQGMTCAENRDLVSGGQAAFEALKEREGIKDCPRCKTTIEKVEGCDHMTCPGCQTHICWKCLATFKTGDECYVHMKKAHKGIGLDHLYRFR